MSNVLVLGATGMLGKMCSLVLDNHEDLNVTGSFNNKEGSSLLLDKKINMVKFDALNDNLKEVIDKVKPEYIINCIGKIKPVIDEEDPLSVSQARHINAAFPKHMEEVSSLNNIRVIQIGTDCVFSGEKGSYSVEDNHDAVDIYGITKSEGEQDSGNKMLIRTSIIGPEITPGRSLLNWFLELEAGSRVNGFKNHMWNGITTLAFAKVARGLITSNSYNPYVVHLTPKDMVTKYDLLIFFRESFKREDIKISPTDAELVVDRTLLPSSNKQNDDLWKMGGYEGSPTISDLVKELSSSVYTETILEGH